MPDSNLQYKRTDPSETEIKLEITIPKDAYDNEYSRQLRELGKDFDLKGFRKGKAPEDIVESSKGSEARTHALEQLISQYASEAMRKEGILPVMSPSVDVGEISEKGDVQITVTIPVIPEITLPDLSKLKVKAPEVDVTEKDVEDVVKRLWQDHRGKFKDKTDKWVASVAPKLGFSSRTMKDLKKEIDGAVRFEKSRIAAQQFANDAMKEAISLAKVKVPQQLIDNEKQDREKSFQQAIHELKMTEDEFCKSRGVTKEELVKQWETDAREAIETEVLLGAYAKEREVEVEESELEQEIEMLKGRSKDPNDEIFDNPEWRSYIKRVLLKRKAYRDFVEEVGGKTRIPGLKPKDDNNEETSKK